MPADVAFIGLGVMGYPMAGHLARAGHRVTVYNRTTAKAEKWTAEFGGRMAKTPREAVQNAKFVFACVGNDDDLRSVVLGESGAFAGMMPGALFAITRQSVRRLKKSWRKKRANPALGMWMRQCRAARREQRTAY